jgi:hypothetical protein
MKAVRLSTDLEKALLQGVISGHCAIDIIKHDELSKKGKKIHEAINSLLRKGRKPPFKRRAVALAAIHIGGMAKDEADSYMASLTEHDAGSEAATILHAAHDKATLISLVNRASEQLASGDLRVGDLTSVLEARAPSAEAAQPLSASIRKRWPKSPSGLIIPSLPEISDITRGLFGVWAIAAEPGVGKTTLCTQIALDLALSYDVLYYDIDGTGQEFIVDRIRDIVGGNIKRFKRRTANLYVRNNISTLDSDLRRIKPPGLVVVDSLQTLPVGVEFAKESLDNWMRRFKDIAAKGFPVLCVSEKQRSEYGSASLKGFKGSGDIEYGVTVGIQLLASEDDKDYMQLHLVKGRHSKKKGHIADLVRDKEKVFWWKEQEPVPLGDDESKRGRRNY